MTATTAHPGLLSKRPPPRFFAGCLGSTMGPSSPSATCGAAGADAGRPVVGVVLDEDDDGAAAVGGRSIAAGATSVARSPGAGAGGGPGAAAASTSPWQPGPQDVGRAVATIRCTASAGPRPSAR